MKQLLGFVYCGFAAPPAYGQKMVPYITAVTFPRFSKLACTQLSVEIGNFRCAVVSFPSGRYYNEFRL